jgi:hypothetical protein
MESWMKRASAVILFLSLMAFGQLEAGAIYRWYDDKGHLHLTQSPPPPGARMANNEGAGKVSVTSRRWSDRMRSNANGFMNNAGVRRVFVDKKGNKVARPKNWY